MCLSIYLWIFHHTSHYFFNEIFYSCKSLESFIKCILYTLISWMLTLQRTFSLHLYFLEWEGGIWRMVKFLIWEIDHHLEEKRNEDENIKFTNVFSPFVSEIERFGDNQIEMIWNIWTINLKYFHLQPRFPILKNLPECLRDQSDFYNTFFYVGWETPSLKLLIPFALREVMIWFRSNW